MEIKNNHDDCKRRFSFDYYKKSWYDKDNGKRLFGFNYYNKEKLGFCDFIEVIKEDLLKHISKNRGFIHEKDRYIYFTINYDDDCVEYGFGCHSNINFGVNGICVDKFVKDLLNCANEEYEERLKEYVDENVGVYYPYFNGEYVNYFDYYDNYYGGVDGYYDKECNINKFDKEFTVLSLEVDIYVNEYKINHKNKFYKNLNKEIKEAVWDYNWYLDFEELRDLNKRW